MIDPTNKHVTIPMLIDPTNKHVTIPMLNNNKTREPHPTQP